MSTIYRLFAIALMLLIFACNVFAQTKSEAERLWELGEKAYNGGRYKEAITFYERSLTLCAGDNECIAADLNGIGTSHEAMGDDIKAFPFYERAMNAARKTNNKDLLATALFNVGAVYYRQAIDYEKAYDYLEESRRYFKELNDKNSLGIVLHYLGKISSMLGRYEKALSSFNETLKIVREQGNQQAIGANLANIGRVYSRLGQYERAISYDEEALKAAKQAKDQEGVSTILRDMGDAYSGLFKHDKAISYYQEAIEIQKRNNFRGELSISFNNLGAFYADLNQYEKALSNYEEALKLAKEQNDAPTTATLLNNIGHVYAKLGRSDRAIMHYQQALEMERRLKRPQSLTYVLNNIGMEYFKVGKYSDALKYLQEALEIDKKLNNPHLLATRLNNIGAVYLKQGRYRDAEYVFLERKKLENRIKPNRLLHPGLVEVYLLTGRYNDALNLIREIPPSWRDNRNRHIEYHTQLAIALKGKNDLKDSAINLLKAVNLVEDMRQSIIEKTGFFAGGSYYSRLTPYKELVSVLSMMSERGYQLPDEFRTYGSNPASVAFYFSELTKARTLLETMAGAARKVQTADIPPDLKTREEELLRELSYIDSRWDEALKKGETAVKELQARQDRAKKRLDSLINELRQKYPRYAALHYPLPVKAEELPLKENEVLFEYAVTDDATYLFVVKKDGIRKSIKIPVTKEALEEDIKTFIEPMNFKEPDRFSIKSAQRLYELLLSEALKDTRENEKIIIVPDGILGLLPFEALVINERTVIKDSTYVADRYTITYYQSATVLALNRILKESGPEKPLFALGNPVYTSDDPRYTAWKEKKKEPYLANLSRYSFRGLSIKAKWGAVTEEEKGGRIEFPPLPETEIEVREIAKIMGVAVEPPQILLSVMANETNVKRTGLEKYRYIHFATHASLPGIIQGINEPFILLGQVENQGDDGFLSLSEVASMKLNAEMVVLSACVTGVGKEVEGEGVVNFARAFQQAGARSVVVSLWEVASEPAVEYMKILYTHLKAGKSRSEALRLARNAIKTKYHNPFYWAVFILHGEG